MHSLPGISASMDQFLLDLPQGDDQARRGYIYDRLVKELNPGSFYETLRVQEMAVALMEISELRGRIDSLRSFLRTHAADRYETATRKHYEMLDRDLLKSRGANQRAMAAHAYGARLLARQWEAFRFRLFDGNWVDHLAICKILVSEGFSDRIENLEGKPFWVVARVLRLFKDPGPIITDLIKHCHTRDAEGSPYFCRLMSEISKVESAEVAMRDLENVCEMKIQFWNEKASTLKADHERQKEEFCAGFTSYPGVASSIRTLISLQKIQFARIAKLEKELRALKREAEKDDERRQCHAARLEAIRNGTLASPSRRKSSHCTPGSHGNTPAYVSATHETDPQEFPAHSEMISVTDHEIAANPEPAADLQFPEWDMIEAVQKAAESFARLIENQAEDLEQPEKAYADPMAHDSDDSRQMREIKSIIGEMSPRELANPHKHERFREIYGRSGRSRRKAMHRLVTQEEQSRGLTRNFVPSG